MVNFQKPNYYHYDANLPIRAYEGNAKEINRPARAEESNETRKSELKEQLQGKDNRPSYTKQQLLNIGFKEEYILGSYFDQSSDNIADKNITLKMKRGLKVDGIEIKNIYELLKALNNGSEIAVQNTYTKDNPNVRTDFERM